MNVCQTHRCSRLVCCCCLCSLCFPVFLTHYYCSCSSAGGSSFSPPFVRPNDPTDRVIISGFGLSASNSVRFENGTSCTPIGAKGISVVLDTIALDGSYLSFAVGSNGLPVGQYSVCLRLSATDVYFKVSNNHLYARECMPFDVCVGFSSVTYSLYFLSLSPPPPAATATAVSPLFMQAYIPSFQFNVTGLGLSTTDAVIFEASTSCTPSGAGFNATVTSVSSTLQVLNAIVGGSGLSPAIYSVCVKFGLQFNYTRVASVSVTVR